MYKLVSTKERPNISGVIDEEHHNRLPQPVVKQITFHDWVHKISMYSPQYIEYKYVEGLPGFDHLQNVVIYWFHDCGILVRFPQKWRCGDMKVGEPGIVYTEDMLFWLIGCEHKNQQCTNLGRCYNNYTCNDCGFSQDIDSSD